MSIMSWLAWRRWPWLPLAMKQWQNQHRDRDLYRLLAPTILEAQAAGVGISDVWATPDTSANEILEWIAEQIAANPRPTARTADHFKILLAHCTETEYNTVQAGGNLHIAADRVLATWKGHRSTWFWDGYDTIAQAIPARHTGLYLAVNAVGAAIDAALTASMSD